MNAMTHSTAAATTPSPRDVRIAVSQAKSVVRMQDDPDLARSVTTTTGIVREGLACDITQGAFRYTADLGRGMGGDCTGPSPSFYARAAIAACVAMAIKMHAAHLSCQFREVRVDVETDMYDLALWGIGPHPAAPLATTIAIAVDTDADAVTVSQIVETALARDPWYLALRDSQVVATALSVTRGQGAAV